MRVCSYMHALLIIGAGGHGQVVAEVASACGYDKIDFLDDQNKCAIGKIEEFDKYLDQYKEAFVGIGNNTLRAQLLRQLRDTGYEIPTLIHPTAYVSKSAKIQEGVIVEPKAIVNTHSSIDAGSIISVGAIIDHDVCIGTCCHINAGAIVMAGSCIESYQKLDAGEVAKIKEEVAHG